MALCPRDPSGRSGIHTLVTSTPCSLLVVDDDPFVLTAIQSLAAEDFDVSTATTAEDAVEVLRRRSVDVILTDQKLPGHAGIDLLHWARTHVPRAVRLLMTGSGLLDHAVEAIHRGRVYRYILKPWRSDELVETLKNAARFGELERGHAQLLRDLRDLNAGLESRVRERTRELEHANRRLEQANRMLEKLALTDPLTGLPNRRAMDRVARAELRRHVRYPNFFTFGFIDVDHFHDVNTRYLLPGGDQVLVGLARTFTQAIRAVDTVGRVGGEEFMLVAPETNEEGARFLAERIRGAVESDVYLYKSTAIRITVSLGIVIVQPSVDLDYGQLKHQAAAALVEAKATGRNRSVVTFSA
jgi:diguanylate cyclase (GGDEF)-like protein